MIAFGFTLIYGTMNFFNMAYGANVLIGAYAFYIFYHLCKIPLILSILLACLITTLIMLVVDRVCYYGFRQRRVPSWTAVVVSMAVNTFFVSIITIIFGSSKVTVLSKIPKTFELFGTVRISSVQLACFLAAVLLMIAITLFLKKAKMGRRIRAISNDKNMARVVGVDVERVFVAIISVSSILASMAGIFYSMDTDLRPTLAATALLKAIVASIVGGVGNIKGALIAAFAIGFIENFAILYIGSGWRDAIPLVLIIVFMLFKPSAFGIKEN